MGIAVYEEKERCVRLAYRVECGLDWETRACRIRGRSQGEAVHWDYRRVEGTWVWNGARVYGLDPGLDIDLGFSPATNLAQLRRMDLAIGEERDMPVAWLDPETGRLSPLSQHYRRLSQTRYAYASPTVGYAETLEIDPVSGFTRRYPGLWLAE